MSKTGDVTEEQRFALKRSVRAESPLRLTWTDRRGAHSVVITGRMVVGSAEAAQIVVTDPAVSRVHAELEPHHEGLWIRDLGSKNGTWVGGVFVVEGRVAIDSEVRLGSVTLALTRDVEAAPVAPSSRESFGPIVGRSLPMRLLFSTLERVAATDFSVLVQGETGTGKELVARALHEESPRRAGPMVVVDCAAIPESLFESQLFGHVRGAFTGAVTAREGDFEAAEGGTIFLDEIGELPASVQPKLLRVLESRTIRRVGETKPRAVDVRIVSATHRDLLSMVGAGTFREDLYFRLAAVPVAIPPLRARLEDVPLLVQRFLPPESGGVLPPDLAAELGKRHWPGNVRELRNFVERALALGVPHALALHERDENARQSAPHLVTAATPASDLPPNPFATISLGQIYKDFREQWADHGECIYLERLLEAHDGNVALAAEHAGLDRTHVYRLLRKHR